MLIQKRTGWTIDGNQLMEKSGRQIAEETFREHDIVCQIDKISTDGTCGGHWCFYVICSMDESNAIKWGQTFE